MPILIVENHGTKRGAPMPPRVLIGRRPMNHLVIDDPAVSRMHAWIDERDGGFVLTDMASRTGTRVNGAAVRGSRTLADGDVIEVGPARLTFLAGDRMPAGVPAFVLPAEPAGSAADIGVRFDCPHCRAPMWAAPQFAGQPGTCGYCRGPFVIPGVSGPATARPARAAPPPSRAADAFRVVGPTARPTRTAAPPASQAASTAALAAALDPTPARAVVANGPPGGAVKPGALCGVCQMPILAAEETAACPSCGLVFHAECWQENYGCSAYGCPQVNALRPPPDPASAFVSGPFAWGGVAAAADAGPDPLAPRTPWEYIVLGASAVAVVVAAVTFGAASAATLVWSIAYLARGRRGRARTNRWPVVAAIALSAAGVVGGAAVSYFLFVAGRRS